MSSQFNWRIIVSLDGRAEGEFDSHSGGEITADVQKRRLGGMRGQKVYPAPSEIGDITVIRGWETMRDGTLGRRCRGRVGVARMSVTVVELGDDGTPAAGPDTRRTYTGLLSGYTDPDSDADGTDPSTMELTMAVEAVS